MYFSLPFYFICARFAPSHEMFSPERNKPFLRSHIERENDMQMVSFVLKSGQILPKGGMGSDKKLLLSEEQRTFNFNLISGQRVVCG